MAGLLSLRNTAPATPVVIVSGREDRETVDQAMGCGAAGFIPKSLSRDGMRAALVAVLAGEDQPAGRAGDRRRAGSACRDRHAVGPAAACAGDDFGGEGEQDHRL